MAIIRKYGKAEELVNSKKSRKELKNIIQEKVTDKKFKKKLLKKVNNFADSLLGEMSY